MNDRTSAPLRRPAVLGFVIGFAMAFVAAVLALTMVVFENLLPWLVPGAALLAPLSDRMAGWNGLLNMVLAGAANGLVYAVLFVLVAALLGRGRAGQASR